jgi:hypothetical protein
MVPPDAPRPSLAVQVDPWTTTAAERRRGVLERWRELDAERRHARLASARGRRMFAQWLRLIAKHAVDTDSIARRQDPLLHYRAAAVRTDLLEIAALLERTRDPEPDCLAALYELLGNGSSSPLYCVKTDVSELYDTIDYVRSCL